jgi:Cation transport ATPase
MENKKEDKLKGLFLEKGLTGPPDGFEDRLMSQIRLIAAGQTKKKEIRSRIIAFLSAFAGILVIIFIPLLILYWMGWDMTLRIPTYDWGFNELEFSPLLLLVACCALFLLIGDTLIRSKIFEKKHKPKLQD